MQTDNNNTVEMRIAKARQTGMPIISMLATKGNDKSDNQDARHEFPT